MFIILPELSRQKSLEYKSILDNLMLKTKSSQTSFFFLNEITLCALILEPLTAMILENQFIVILKVEFAKKIKM